MRSGIPYFNNLIKGRTYKYNHLGGSKHNPNDTVGVCRDYHKDPIKCHTTKEEIKLDGLPGDHNHSHQDDENDHHHHDHEDQKNGHSHHKDSTRRHTHSHD